TAVPQGAAFWLRLLRRQTRRSARAPRRASPTPAPSGRRDGVSARVSRVATPDHARSRRPAVFTRWAAEGDLARIPTATSRAEGRSDGARIRARGLRRGGLRHRPLDDALDRL